MAEGSSSGLKKCLIRRTGQQEQHGVAAASLQELKTKACKLLAIDGASQPITLVLAEDGTIIDDDDYFLCLPQNIKFGVVAKNEKWTCTGGGTSWLEEEITNTDETDSSGEKWKALARQLKNNLSTIILMSEEDLQVLVDVPCSDLARELSDNLLQTQRLQTTLQEILDRREEERQSRQLLELYLQAVEKEKQAISTAQAPEAEEKSSRGTDTVDTRSSGPGSVKRAWMNPHILSVLKEETFPQHSLSTEDLMLIYKEDSEVLSQALTWDKEKTKDLKESCRQELSRQLTSFSPPVKPGIIYKAPESGEKSSGGTDTVDMGSSGPSSVERTSMHRIIFSLLKERSTPELSLGLQDLQMICKEDSEVLSQALFWDKKKTEALKEACLLELYERVQQFFSVEPLRNITKAPEAGEKSSRGTDTVDMGSKGLSSVERAWMNPHILSLLKEEIFPEHSLGSQDLQLICKEDSKVLCQALSWDRKKTEDLKEDCKRELRRRLKPYYTPYSLRTISKVPEDEILPVATDIVDMDSSGPSSVKRAWMNTHVLSMLKKSISPELFLSLQDLELICKEDSKVLCQALSWDRKKTEYLKEKCERELSRRLKPSSFSLMTLSNVPEDEILPVATDIVDMDSSGPSSVKRAWMNTHVLSMLKKSISPELFLSLQDLELICKEDSKVLCQALSWDRKKTEYLKEKCERELSRRLKPSSFSLMTLSNVPEDEILPVATDIVDMDSSGPSSVKRAWMNTHVLSMLKKSISPELFLSLQDLELICKEDSKVLCQALSWDRKKTEDLKEDCKRELRRRLEPYYPPLSPRTLSKVLEGEILPVATDIVDMDSSGPSSVKRAWMNTHVLSVLKENNAPELSLGVQDLKLIYKEDSKVLSQALNWDKKKTEDLKEACGKELSRRLESFNSLESLRSISKGKKKLPESGEGSSSKRKK
ncbi:DNA fragmentation factor subunit alpha isoform X2 [Erythrolamprus reginae]|uniref:DNA fragmentation factor subunit alpha isoform X2 n=1 Tax=Erythrolamprus reginae TaxID=121349 RepID=UPI00396CA81E